MSGILRYHDITYKIMGQILRQGAKVAVWSVKSLTKAVLKGLNQQDLDRIKGNGKEPEKEVRRLIYYSKHRSYLNPKLQTTRLGATKLEQLSFSYLEMSEPWDKKWRIVMYDIPEDKRYARDQVRKLVKQLGFVQLQQSVWVHPLPCLKEFEIIKKANGLDNTLVLVETASLEGVSRYKRHFKNLYPLLKF